jgi:hypothetical protein
MHCNALVIGGEKPLKVVDALMVTVAQLHAFCRGFLIFLKV